MAFDTIIRGAQIIDGTGAPPFPGDVAIRAGKIAAIGNLSGVECARVIDAAGRYLTPGFIDIHRHADEALFRPGFGLAELSQGLTTLINGNCGLSIAPMSGPFAKDACAYLAPVLGEIPPEHRFPSLGAYFRAVKDTPLHQAQLAGMGTLRTLTAGFSGGDLDAEQEAALHRLLEQALSDGAVGVSLGLGYAPECFYSTPGLIRALAPLKNSGIPITVHMRQEGAGVVDALREMLTVARALRTPVEISHLKAIGQSCWKKAVPEMLELIARTREDGFDVMCDVYPYSAGSTQLIHVLPPEFQEGGTAALTTALKDPAQRKAIRRRMETGTDFENITLLVGFENVVATAFRRAENLRWEGWSIDRIARARNQDPYEALFDLLAEEECGISMIDFIADESDIALILKAPFSGVISDSTYPSAGLVHPRVYGAFTRLLETYVREKRLLSLPEAVHKITQQSARRFHLSGKGQIAEGYDADLCLFNLENIHETGTYANPACPAAGMDAVFVSGFPALENGTLTSHPSGSVIRRA